MIIYNNLINNNYNNKQLACFSTNSNLSVIENNLNSSKHLDDNNLPRNSDVNNKSSHIPLSENSLLSNVTNKKVKKEKNVVNSKIKNSSLVPSNIISKILATNDIPYARNQVFLDSSNPKELSFIKKFTKQNNKTILPVLGNDPMSSKFILDKLLLETLPLNKYLVILFRCSKQDLDLECKEYLNLGDQFQFPKDAGEYIYKVILAHTYTNTSDKLGLSVLHDDKSFYRLLESYLIKQDSELEDNVADMGKVIFIDVYYTNIDKSVLEPSKERKASNVKSKINKKTKSLKLDKASSREKILAMFKSQKRSYVTLSRITIINNKLIKEPRTTERLEKKKLKQNRKRWLRKVRDNLKRIVNNYRSISESIESILNSLPLSEKEKECMKLISRAEYKVKYISKRICKVENGLINIKVRRNDYSALDIMQRRNNRLALYTTQKRLYSDLILKENKINKQNIYITRDEHGNIDENNLNAGVNRNYLSWIYNLIYRELCDSKNLIPAERQKRLEKLVSNQTNSFNLILAEKKEKVSLYNLCYVNNLDLIKFVDSKLEFIVTNRMTINELKYTDLDLNSESYKSENYNNSDDKSQLLYQLAKNYLTHKQKSELFMAFLMNVARAEFIQNISNENTEDSYVEGIIETKGGIELGNKIAKYTLAAIYNQYLIDNNLKSDYTMTKWKNSIKNKHILNLIDKIPSSLYYLGMHFINLLSEGKFIVRKLNFSTSNKNSYNSFILDPEIKPLFTLRTMTSSISPVKIPMLIPPVDYVHNSEGEALKLGGYLGNDKFYTEGIFIDKAGYKNKTIVKHPHTGSLDCVNGLSKVAFKINLQVLEFLNCEGINKNLLIAHDDPDLIKLINNKPKNRDKLNKLKSKFSKYILEVNLMSIAHVFKDETFYMPIRMDQRTRLYAVTDYLNYQGSNLAKSLLLFNEAGSLRKSDHKAITYLKAYGAICFGNGIEKLSLKGREKWVDDHSEEILNFRNNDILSKAEDKYTFISFCFFFEKLNKFLSNDCEYKPFYTNLPIQLDATCNGYQHLALLSKDPKALAKLNLTKASIDTPPKDLYQILVLEIREFILKLNDVNSDEHKKYVNLDEDSLIENKVFKVKSDKEISFESVKKLAKFDFNRSMVKKAVMTFIYNASSLSQKKYITNELESTRLPESNRLVWYHQEFGEGNPDLRQELTGSDIFTWLKCFRLVVKDILPKVDLIARYIKQVVTIFNILDMAVPWVLPTGTIISSYYQQSKELRIKSLNVLSSKINLTGYLNKLGARKQAVAVMPNLIHSLDASSISLLWSIINDSLKEKAGSFSLYTVHDCFAVTADKVEMLIQSLITVYIKIYHEEEYLRKFDSHIKKTLIDYDLAYYDKDKQIIIINNPTNHREVRSGSARKTYPLIDIDKIVEDNNEFVVNLKQAINILK